MKKMIVDLIYFNVIFRTVAKNETDVTNLLQFANYTREHGTTMKHMSTWLNGHGLEYTIRFKWNWNYPLTANLWNLFSFIRFKIEEQMK